MTGVPNNWNFWRNKFMADFKAHTSVWTLWGLLLGAVSIFSVFCSFIGGDW